MPRDVPAGEIAALPLRAVVFVTGWREAERLRNGFRAQHGWAAAQQISFMWGSPAWHLYARGMARLAGRPFVELAPPAAVPPLPDMPVVFMPLFARGAAS